MNWVGLAYHMKFRNRTAAASAYSATIGATRWTVGQWAARVAIGSLLLAVVACGIGLLAAWLRPFADPLTPGRRAYDRGDWVAAARSAREVLKRRQGDPAALRLLARSSVQLGHDDTALGIYTRRLEAESIQAADYLLLGVALKRQGRDDGAMWAWNKVLEAESVPPQTLNELTELLYVEAVETRSEERRVGKEC